MDKWHSIVYEDVISYAHILRTPPCNVLHGHNARVRIEIQSTSVDEKTGMIVNFYDLKKILKSFDHVTLICEEHREGWSGRNHEEVIVKISGKSYVFPTSDVLFLTEEPTVENISEVIANQIQDMNSSWKVKVVVWETDKACAGYE